MPVEKPKPKPAKTIKPIRFGKQFSETMRASLDSLPELDVSEEQQNELDAALEVLFAKEEMDVDDLIDLAGLLYAQAAVCHILPDDEEGDEDEDEDEDEEGPFHG